MPKTIQRNFHVPLPTELYHELKEESERLERPATVLAREAIASYLEARKRQVLAGEIAAYAAAQAGSETDLDEDLEAAGLEHVSGNLE